MASHYMRTMLTPSVRAAQEKYFGKSHAVPETTARDPLTPEETAFISARDSFYLATLSDSGWPYVQHRGGPAGFLKVLHPGLLGFADYKGNRQLLSAGNLDSHDRVSLFLMDYVAQERLKILGHGRWVSAADEPGLVPVLIDPSMEKMVERFFLIDVVSYDWNCPQYITPRYTRVEVEKMMAPLRERIAGLEGESARG
ncbi:MAG: pyridoxamine 5'-phosphate oxidase family protein [Verrucomicrobiae bacterium]|nr:pyridoxamine 5'-phosphate oxidase family protein [Verrucomicrobiae bacterium]